MFHFVRRMVTLWLGESFHSSYKSKCISFFILFARIEYADECYCMTFIIYQVVLSNADMV